MKTEIVKLTQISVNGANPRTITDEKFDKLIDSLLVLPKMLELRPIVVDETFMALGGNMRYRALSAISEMSADEINDRLSAQRDFQRKTAAEQAQLAEYWAKWVNNPTAPVVRASELSEDERRAFIIKDNVGYGDWDMDALANEWDVHDLDDWGVDFDFELPPDENEAKEDDFDEQEDEIIQRAEIGDIWQCGEHRLMCGDSTSKENIDALMNGELADMVFTDPPYGVAIGDKNKTLNEVNGVNAIESNIANDDLSVDELYPILVQAMTNCRESCADDAVYFVTSPQGGELGLMMMMMKDAGLPVRHMLIWKKNAATFSLGRLDYDYQHEPIFYTWTKKHHNHRNGEYRTTIWEYDKPRVNDLHPTMKPVALVANALKDGSKQGDVVLDIFGGSGTTMIACEELGRKARLMEIDPHYADVILTRWEKLTGKQAVKLR